jgi:hypothetical protein
VIDGQAESERMASMYDVQQWARALGEWLSKSLKWSSLTTIGQSPLVRFTILIPFIGYMILFNSHVLEWLNLSIDHVSQISGKIIDRDIQTSYTSNRLNFLYFGLVLVGLASTLFAIVAPEEIKRHPLPAEYITYVEPIATTIFTRTSFGRVIDAFMKLNTEEQRSPMFSLSPFSFPSIVSHRLHSLITTLYESTDLGDPEGHDNQDLIFEESLYTGSGYLKTDEIIEKLYFERRIEFEFVRRIFRTAMDYKKDVFFLEHMTLDYSKFYTRMIISALYGIGFALLLIPTIQTTWQLLINWML